MKTAATGAIWLDPIIRPRSNETRIEFAIKSDKAKNPYRIVIDMDDYALANLISKLKIAAETRAKVHDARAQMLRRV